MWQRRFRSLLLHPPPVERARAGLLVTAPRAIGLPDHPPVVERHEIRVVRRAALCGSRQLTIEIPHLDTKREAALGKVRVRVYRSRHG